MAIQVDAGKAGPHPEIKRPLIEFMKEVLPQLFPDAEVSSLTESDVSILQQRTLSNLTWIDYSRTDEHGNHSQIVVDVSVGLALCIPPNSTKHLAMFWARRPLDGGWAVTRMSNTLLEDPPEKPRKEFVKLGRGLGIGWGVFDRSGDLGRLRMSLENGEVTESVVEGGAALMFVPFHSEEMWASTVTFEWLDGGGDVILREDYPLPPAYPHRGGG